MQNTPQIQPPPILSVYDPALDCVLITCLSVFNEVCLSVNPMIIFVE